jgi:D-arabinose 1-dehydrogenase-like Zn-dependent alcohol dehydrogenase
VEVEIIHVAEPLVELEGVPVEVRYVGLCSSELGIYRGIFSIDTYPRIPGLWVSGIIVGRGESPGLDTERRSSDTLALHRVWHLLGLAGRALQ